ncbi:MAG: ABC transporter ATP-binding protein, partial [Leptolyngbyaceae bacterium]|nr:ABC transporter ATP-binding protein [Leptolyngbyaceae bacterium]
SESAETAGAQDKPSWAVDDVSLSIQPGERVGLVGESGCGKSTLGRAAMRLLPGSTRIEGRVLFDGQSVFDLTPSGLRRFRGEAIALIFQDPMTRLDPLMTVGDHCLETLRAHQPHLSKADAKAQAIATLEAVSIPADRWNQYPHEFSGGMRQRVAIALALLLSPKLIVADEPTTSLDVTVSAQILTELTRLCQERDMALMLISHDLPLVAEYCDRIAVMYQGKLVENEPVSTLLSAPKHPYTLSLLNSARQLQTATPPSAIASSEDTANGPAPILRLQSVKKHFVLEQNVFSRFLKAGATKAIKAVDGVSIDLYPGEILGLVGESGCGKSTLSRLILHLLTPTSGHITFMGQDLTQLSKGELLKQRQQIQMVFQDPHACLNPMMTVGQGIADPLLIHNLASPQEAEQRTRQLMERVGLKPVEEFYHRYPGELSGGQQQRVAIARALILRPKVLVCDEPVSMLDASVQAQVLNLMLDLKDEFELTYLFITHDLWVARFLCHRIAVMHAGEIVESGPTATVFNTPQHPYTKSLLGAAPLLAHP